MAIQPYSSPGQLPSKTEVCLFINDLLNFLFQLDKNCVTKNEESLRKQLIALLQPAPTNAVTNHFFEAIPSIMDNLKKDAALMLESDPAAQSFDEVIITYPGFKAIAVYRLAHYLFQLHVPLIPRMMCEWSHSQTGIDIHPGAQIDCPFMIDHGTGVVIGETAVIGKNVKIYQGVTLGALAVKKEAKQTKRHPTIKDNVVLYAGSTILGGETVIGNDCIIGGNTWITESVPAFCIVYNEHQTIVRDRRELNDVLNFVI
jgi:serine O-acetyltransferase